MFSLSAGSATCIFCGVCSPFNAARSRFPPPRVCSSQPSSSSFRPSLHSSRFSSLLSFSYILLIKNTPKTRLLWLSVFTLSIVVH
uniref:Uncharacterized protein n=1 Tax=Ixodes ricinus TaxID=34613 RepID=A0A6B0TY47_IXORI